MGSKLYSVGRFDGEQYDIIYYTLDRKKAEEVLEIANRESPESLHDYKIYTDELDAPIYLFEYGRCSREIVGPKELEWFSDPRRSDTYNNSRIMRLYN